MLSSQGLHRLASHSSFSLGKINKFLFALTHASVPAHVEMMGFLGIGNNPMVGATVAIAVDIASALSK